MRPGAKCVLLICAIALLAVAALFFIKPVSLKPPPPKPTIASELAKIRASGAPVHVIELRGQRVPDAQNGAPIFEKAFKELDRVPKADLDAIFKFSDHEERKKDPTLWSKAGRAVSRCRRIGSLVEQAASRPECRFPRDWSKGMYLLYPECTPARATARILAADAVLSANDGRTGRALRLIRLALGISDSFRNDPAVIPMLTRNTTISITLAGLEEVVRRRDITERQARELSSVMARIDLKSESIRALAGERAMGIWVFDQARQGKNVLLSLKSIRMELLARLLDRDELYYLQEMARQIELCRLPYRVVKQKRLDEYPDVPTYAPISASVFLSAGMTIRQRDRTEARLALAQTSLALEVRRNRCGAYPASIGELRSKLHWPIPKDPFSGKDLVYKKTPRGYVLYSIGMDLKDDGGAPDEMDTGDILWGQP